MEPINKEHLDKVLNEYKKDKVARVARHALSVASIQEVAQSKDEASKVHFDFDINIETLPVTNQRQSGRCWIFAACNVMREELAKKFNVKNFELSQSYLAFYDKLEKLNYVMEALMENIKADYDDRTVQFLVQNGVGDGGQWDMIVSVIKKYGICPKNNYGETSTSNATRYLNQLLNAELRHFASESRIVFAKKGMTEVKKLKESYVDRFYRALVSCYGLPPEKFDFEYTDSKNVYHIERGLTPIKFFEKYIGSSLDEYVSVINAPTNSKPFMKSYTVKYLGNVVGGKVVTHLNLPMERLKEVVVAQLKDNHIVWFGSDVGPYGERELGIWDDNRFDYKSLLDLDIKMDKGESLDFRSSAMNHAMCITGVAFDQKGIPTKWKIENSWGEANGNKGYYIMSRSWFDQYTYQAVVNKKYLTKEELNAYNSKPIELKPWDPMGSLAD